MKKITSVVKTFNLNKGIKGKCVNISENILVRLNYIFTTSYIH